MQLCGNFVIKLLINDWLPMKCFNYILLITPLFIAFPLLAQQQAVEDTSEILLLENEDVQIASAQAINDMYNFKFDKAELQFNI